MQIVALAFAEYAVRLLSLFPASWLSDDAKNPGTGLAYWLSAVFGYGISVNDTNLAYQALQTRIATATDTNLDAIADDLFGPNEFPRIVLVNSAGAITQESDDAYRARILAEIVAPNNTLFAIQLAVSNYVDSFVAAELASGQMLLGLDTSGGLDTIGGLDGAGPSVPSLPTITVFDRQSNPILAAKVSLQPGQFCILLSYGKLTSTGFFLGKAHLGRTSGGGAFLVSDDLRVISAPIQLLDQLIRRIKAVGTTPVYADNLGT